MRVLVQKNALLLQLILLAATRVSESNATCADGSSSGAFLWLSDAHYDAYYGTPTAQMHLDDAPCRNGADAPVYSAYGCGSSLELVTSAVQESARLSSELLSTNSSDCRVDFIIFTGDSVRHDVGDIVTTQDEHGAVVNNALTVLYDLFAKYYPGVPTVELPPIDLGNNDLDGHDKLVVTSGEPCFPSANLDGIIFPNATNEWLINVTATHRDLFISDLEASVFACGGYVNREVRPNLRVIVLNTIVYSIKHNPKVDSDIIPDPFGQFEWLEKQLTDARTNGDKVYLTGHIPPMLESFIGEQGAALVQTKYSEKYFEVLQNFSDVISAQMYGHVHTNELRAVDSDYMPDDAPPMMLHASISPCYSNRPFFTVVHYDDDDEAGSATMYPTDLVPFNLNLDKHNETSVGMMNTTTNTSVMWERMFSNLTSYLGMAGGLTNAETRLLAKRMAKKNDDDDAFGLYFNNWYTGVPQENCHADYTCQLKESCLVYSGFDNATWQDCIANAFGSSNPPPPPPPPTLSPPTSSTSRADGAAVPFLSTFMFMVVLSIPSLVAACF